MPRGRPTPLRLGGLFLFHPETVAKMDEVALSAAFAHAGQSALLKALKRQQTAPTRKAAASKLLDRVLQLTMDNPGPLIKTLADARNGDAASLLAIEHAGPWQCWRDSRPHVETSSQELRLLNFFVDVEERSRPAEQQLIAKNYRAAAKAIASDPLLCRFIEPVALDALTEATGEVEPWLGAPGAVRTLVAQVALLDVIRADDDGRVGQFRHLLTAQTRGSVQGAAFTKWLKAELGARSISDLLNMQVGADAAPDESTWKRWHSGAIFPPERALEPVVKQALIATQEDRRETRRRRIGAQFWAARRLHHAASALKLLQAANPDRTFMLLGRPASTHLWMAQTYEQWLDHWRTSH